MDYPRIVEAVNGTPWAILPEKFAEIQAFIRAKAAGAEVPPMEAARRPATQRAGNGKVALLPLFGVLAQRMNLMTEFSGGTSTEEFGAEFDRLVADGSVGSILLVIDSPGGSVFGTAELANKIYKARGDKPIVAIADSLAASAAYWVGSQADEFVVTPGGQVGSIGVIAAHLDESEAEKQAGVKTTLVTAGKYKAEGDPSQPLSAEARAGIQDMVDKYYAMFVSAVARGRGVSESVVRTGMGEGRMKLAYDAVGLKMADGISTLQDAIQRMAAGQRVGGRATSASTAKAGGLPLAVQARLADLAIDAETDRAKEAAAPRGPCVGRN